MACVYMWVVVLLMMVVCLPGVSYTKPVYSGVHPPHILNMVARRSIVSLIYYFCARYCTPVHVYPGKGVLQYICILYSAHYIRGLFIACS
jgi:hypothetical protein